MLIALAAAVPRVDPSAYVHASAQVIGDAQIGPGSSIWFNAVIRADVYPVRIGARSNIQDNVTVHVTSGRHAPMIGDDVTVGHNAVLHGCTVGHRCLIGIGAIVLDGCTIGDDCFIGAGALLTPRTTVTSGQVVLGAPARAIRLLSDTERAHILQSAAGYVANAARYRAAGIT